MSPLHYAVKSPECVQFLIDQVRHPRLSYGTLESDGLNLWGNANDPVAQHATVDCVDAKGRTPLSLAVKVENEDSVRMLIMAGADIEATDNEGKKVGPPFGFPLDHNHSL